MSVERGRSSQDAELGIGSILTSGKVPLEKTLSEKATVRKQYVGRRHKRWPQSRRYLHKETGLSAGTVANDDKLASNFRHSEFEVHVSKSGLA